MDSRYIDQKIVEVGDTPSEAKQKLSNMFDELATLVVHVAILDMASAFELTFRSKIKNAIGESRKAVRAMFKKNARATFSEALIKTEEDLEGLKKIAALLAHDLSLDVRNSLEIIRDGRNAFSHGTSLSDLPEISPEEARDSLNDATERL